MVVQIEEAIKMSHRWRNPTFSYFLFNTTQRNVREWIRVLTVGEQRKTKFVEEDCRDWTETQLTPHLKADRCNLQLQQAAKIFFSFYF